MNLGLRLSHLQLSLLFLVLNQLGTRCKFWHSYFFLKSLDFFKGLPLAFLFHFELIYLIHSIVQSTSFTDDLVCFLFIVEVGKILFLDQVGKTLNATTNFLILAHFFIISGGSISISLIIDQFFVRKLDYIVLISLVISWGPLRLRVFLLGRCHTTGAVRSILVCCQEWMLINTAIPSMV